LRVENKGPGIRLLIKKWSYGRSVSFTILSALYSTFLINFPFSS
jgi:hypothetical protein